MHEDTRPPALSPTPPGATNHLAYLDGLRALAALWVVMHHSWFWVADQLHGAVGDVLGFFIYGRLAVDLFIVLSGFCLTLPVLKNQMMLRGGVVEFLKRRAWRILPPYYCAMAFSLLLIALLIHQKTGTPWDRSLPITTRSVASHLVMLHDAVGEDYSINGVFWSIAVEWRIYFFFPLLLLVWRQFGALSATVFGLVLSWILFLVCTRLIGASLTLNYLGLFSVGMFASGVAFSDEKGFLFWRKLPWGWITLLLLLGVVTIYHVDAIKNGLRDYGVGFLSMSFLILLSLRRDTWYHRFVASPPLAFIGTFAYSIYLIHVPLIQVFWQYLLVPLHPYPVAMLGVLLSIGVPAIVGISYLFFLVCERPFLRRKKT